MACVVQESWEGLVPAGPMPHILRVRARARLLVAAASLFLATTAAPARAAPLQPITAYSIWLTGAGDPAVPVVMPETEAFYQCLTASSTFAQWAARWGFVLTLQPVSVDVTPPTVAQYGVIDGPPLQGVLTFLIESHLVPAPGGDNDTIYMVHAPSTAAAEDTNGDFMCGVGPCAEHTVGTYGELHYEMVLLPLSCERCRGAAGTATYYGEHELGEAATDEMGASFEVGDPCDGKGNVELYCGGRPFQVQPLADPDGTCQPIVGADPAVTGCFPVGALCGSDTECCNCCGAGAECDQGQCTACAFPGSACVKDADCCGGFSCVDAACQAPSSANSSGLRCALFALGAGGSNVPLAFLALAVATALTRRALRQRKAASRMVDGVRTRK